MEHYKYLDRVCVCERETERDVKNLFKTKFQINHK